MSDISEAWYRRKKLEQTTGLISEIRAVTAIGIWEANLTQKTLYWSKETCSLFGIDPEFFDGRPESFFSLLLDEDRHKFGYDCIANDGSFEVEYRIRRADTREIRWLYNRGKQVIDPADGISTLRLGVVMDITERKRIDELNLIESDLFHVLSQKTASHRVLERITDEIGRLFFDASACILLVDHNNAFFSDCIAPELDENYVDLLLTEPLSARTNYCAISAGDNEPVIGNNLFTDDAKNKETELLNAMGYRAIWATPITNTGNEVRAILALYLKDPKRPTVLELELLERINKLIKLSLEKAQTEARLKESEQRFRQAFHDAATGVALIDEKGQFLEVNNSLCQMLSLDHESLLKLSLSKIIHPDDRQEHQQQMLALETGEIDSFIIEKRCSTTKVTVWVRMSISAQRAKSGHIKQIVLICENITDRVIAEEQLAGLFSNLPGMAYRCRYKKHWQMLFVSPGIKKLFGVNPDEMIDNPELSISHFIVPEEKTNVENIILEGLKKDGAFKVEYCITDRYGNKRWLWEQGKLARHSDQSALIIDGYITDISETRQALQALENSEKRFELLSKATNDALWDWDLTSNALWWNEGLENLFGVARADVKPSIESWTDRIHPQDKEKVLEDIELFIEKAKESQSWTGQYRFQRADGSYATVIDRAYLELDHENKPIRMIGGMNDITDRIELEAQLHQSQRLESIGQLTGGVAHDFNNLLTVIQGNAEMLADRLEDGFLLNMAEMIINATHRGAELTQGLLAFARKQPMNAVITETAELLRKIEPLLVRTIGEQVKVKLVINHEPSWIRVDPGLLENAILNLALNARDAMKQHGGTLTITLLKSHTVNNTETITDKKNKSFITIRVQDTGEGIPEALQQHVFEPFFTTKRKGEGTGLGLSMVYGFVKQSEGQISIESELTKGSTVIMDFPMVEPVKITHNAEKAKNNKPLESGDEIILLVEDDDLVREFARSQLVSLGYRVIQATNGAEALEVIKHNPTIDLLFTDVVMPEMNGRELAEKAAYFQPQLKVLFTSGYTEDTILLRKRLENKAHLLPKPYRTSELAAYIRHALDEKFS
jgi:PAS domain S-box-containing protein